ncbi:rhodanese-like domain-containing protein [Paraflavitalea sp. CAU 1676]|uniref:MBL fold metallo-hydrolase n=1 Tax=Paraflavitalea sp. CAU 1676 TaxID=3032598 RepID=UPI0023DB7F3F|nr:rhodanese-like domain-containing protein [Paraflavitalea sp. CAU 1676]MDF2191310.1 rhodanese-like domain-containing protein [Paraflavitalea sp. CAU 1676]
MKKQEISVAELQQLLNEGTQVQILDIRPQQQRDEWMIAGSIHKDVYEEIIAGNQNALDDVTLSADVPVVTVCGGGRSSLIAADILNQKGYHAYSLQGGMKAWNYAWSTAEIKTLDVTIIQVKRVAKGCLSYIIGSGEQAIVIDAALDPATYTQLAENYGWKIVYIMDTHLHADYISRSLDLAGELGAELLFNKSAETDFPFTGIHDGQIIPFGQSIFEVIFTPGHTAESTSFLVNNQFLFTGDTLFTNGVGRPDLKANESKALLKAEQLYNSIQHIKSFPGETFILPAHTSQSLGFDNTVITSRLFQIVAQVDLLSLSKEDFVKQTLERISPTPPNYEQIALINKTGNHEGITPSDLEAGANRCAVS